MKSNKTTATGMTIDSFLESISEARQEEAAMLIAMMQGITGEKPFMWGPSIVGFGSQHYKYDTGREGEMPRLAFSPRKANITLYFSEGFDRYADELATLGKHKQSVSCLYVSKLTDIDLDVLRVMLKRSFDLADQPRAKPNTVDEYVASVPTAARPMFDELRRIVQNIAPHSKEVLSYGIIGYKIDQKRARVYISGWKDHVAMYPLPKNKELLEQLAPFIKGKGTIWLPLDTPLPKSLIESIVKTLISSDELTSREK